MIRVVISENRLKDLPSVIANKINSDLSISQLNFKLNEAFNLNKVSRSVQNIGTPENKLGLKFTAFQKKSKKYGKMMRLKSPNTAHQNL